MSTTSLITVSFRLLQLIPLVLVFIPIFCSYWQRRNKINGLRKIRVALLALLSSIIFSNVYFILFSYFDISRATTQGIVVLFLDKAINLIAYFLVYLFFKHASKHEENKE